MAMFTRSPALPASRPPGLIDPHQPADYAVLLGTAFKDIETHSPQTLSMRYNWKSQKPTSISRTHLGKSNSSSDDSYEVVVEDRLHKNRPYRYTGNESVLAARGSSEGVEPHSDQSLALIWDPAKSAFLLEPISVTMDFNLMSAPDQSQREINAHKRLRASEMRETEERLEAITGPEIHNSGSDSDPDISNPYDFRHFLTEARENITNGASGARSRTPIPGSRKPIPGSKTPIPGNHTPLPSQSSPALGAQKSTPQFHATSTSTKKRKLDRPISIPTQKPKPQPASRKHGPSSQPLSERINDFDDDTSNPPTSHRKYLSTLNSPISHHLSSPHLIVSDASASLEIDLGSPPPKYTQRKRPNVNPDAFNHRSHANTPIVTQSQDEDEDVEMQDTDVEELALGSPRSGPLGSSAHKGRSEWEDAVEAEEEDDDDDLAAELEAALEEEEAGEGVGLGISAGREDESEVSEEE